MLKGKHTGLRAIDREDLPFLLDWRNTPELRRYFREYRELSTAQQNAWFENVTFKDNRTLMFAIVELATSRLLGASGLCYIDWVNKNADFSIYIGANDLYIDDAFAPDAAITMARYAFHELGMHRLWSEIYDFDSPKKCFFEKLGFSMDGRHRQTHWGEGKWHDSLFFGILADEFEARHGT